MTASFKGDFAQFDRIQNIFAGLTIAWPSDAELRKIKYFLSNTPGMRETHEKLRHEETIAIYDALFPGELV